MKIEALCPQPLANQNKGQNLNSYQLILKSNSPQNALLLFHVSHLKLVGIISTSTLFTMPDLWQSLVYEQTETIN